MEFMDKVSKRIVELREAKGETQQELADAIGITRQSLSRYEIAARTINVDVLGALAQHFKVTTDYLLGLSDIKSTDQDMKIACEVTGLSDDTVTKLHSRTTGNDENKEIYNCMISNKAFYEIADLLKYGKIIDDIANTLLLAEESNIIKKDKNDVKCGILAFQRSITFNIIKDTSQEWAVNVLESLTGHKWNFSEAFFTAFQKCYSIGSVNGGISEESFFNTLKKLDPVIGKMDNESLLNAFKKISQEEATNAQHNPEEE